MDAKELSTLGIKALKERTAKEDEKILEIIKANPGVTASEIGKVLGKPAPTIHLSIDRLLEQDKIQIKFHEHSGQKIKLVEPRQSVIEIKKVNSAEGEQLPFIKPEIEPPGHFNVTDKQNKWLNTAYAYALTNNQIVVSSTKDAEFENKALKIEEIPIQKSGSDVSFTLPYDYILFYQLDQNTVHKTEEGGYSIFDISPAKKIVKKASSNVNPHILVVEDEPEWVGLLKRELKKSGLTNVTFAHSVEGAKKEIRNSKFDIVIYDLRIDQGGRSFDAFEIEQWAQQNNYKHRHFYVTAKPYGEEDVKRAIEYHGEALYSKGSPYYEKQLVARIRSELQRHGDYEYE